MKVCAIDLNSNNSVMVSEAEDRIVVRRRLPIGRCQLVEKRTDRRQVQRKFRN